ncbi:MAG: TolC family outer membrane protein, partial [Rubrivivax sp.]
MIPSPRTLVGAACLALLGATQVQAQTLQELYEAARTYDAAYLAARASAQSAEFRAAQAEALVKPSASLSANATTTLADAPRVGTGDTNALGATLSGRYPLFNRANQATIAQARKSLLAAQSDLETAEQDLIVRLSQAYFDVLAAQDALGASRANKAAITEQLASAKRNFEVGTATITDTREAQARFDLASAQEIAAENDLRTKRIALDQLVGRTGVAPHGLLAPVVLPPPEPADAERWVGQADTVHPVVRKARVALEVAQLETERARAAQLPTVDAIGTVGASRSAGSSATLPGNTRSATVGVQLNWPLYTGQATENRIRETVALEEKSRNDVEAARRAVAQATRQAFFGVQSGLAQIRALEAAESSTKLALEATQLGYRVGVRVNLDVLNSQTQLFQTQRDLSKARYDVIVGSLRLRQASGQLREEDLRAVSVLLRRTQADASTPTLPGETARVQAISSRLQDDTEIVRVGLSGPLGGSAEAFSTPTPARIAVDLPGASSLIGRGLQEFNQGNVRSARVVESEDRTRVVLNLREIAPYQVRQSSEAVLVIVQPPGSAPAGMGVPAAPAAPP